MNIEKKHIVGALIALSVFTFVLRIIPVINLGDASIITLYSADDPHYNLRLVELYVQNWQYQWFDPLTYFPYGLWLNWGPLFTTVCAWVCIAVGASTPAEIAYVSIFVPALMAAACIPIAYVLGREIGDWKTGMIAAIMLAFMGGQFFHRSVAGYLDHHTAEVLFSLLFVTAYVWAIKNREKWIIYDGKWLLPGIPVIAIVGSFMLLMYTMPTVILFAFVVFIFTLIWMAIHKPRDSCLAKLNCISFLTIILLYLITIPWTPELNLDGYSLAPVIAYAALAVVGILFVFKDGKYTLPTIGGIAIISLLVEPIRYLTVGSFLQFFGQTAYTSTVQEARAWTFNDAMLTFGIAVPLTLFGIIVMVYKVIKDRKPQILFVATWAILISFATIQHIRYEYYFAPVAAITTAYVLSEGINLIKPKEVKIKTRQQKKNKDTTKSAKRSGTVRTVLAVMTAGLIIYFCIVSGLSNYVFSSSVKLGTNQEWVESLQWMKTNTPDTGMHFNEVYTDRPEKYPAHYNKYTNESYGVMSWWDYGHIIQYYANRPPNSNPFQAGVYGTYGAARFFVTNSENETIKIAKELRTKYVVTDIEMATGKFWAMSTWADVAPGDYQDYLYANNQGSQVLKRPYYETTIARLHLFDGSYRSGPIIYVEYNTNHVVTYAQQFNTTAEADAFSSGRTVMGNKAYLGLSPASPPGEVPALKHFRLVHESPTDIGNGMRYVKVFEYVNGATIRGEGLIYTEVTTNTNRKFLYGQMSENGLWTLPYPGIYYKQDGSTITISEELIV